ncbi:unnamed protein product [Parascedosporium putredinis]|uniref:Alpha/beta hydrolase fold-3 domain-containing protein n=1 Tax=Parascedosporium putredinis TaxID=1442378 RepID=A0A9P1HBU6_9PEZI|nr:unnamed protein product [Parascedosporium putredinis]CAI8003699.1 unnamed protein product [Parascedosporium putredinis]
MENQRVQLLLTLLPKLPLILRVAILHILRRSESAKYLDLRSAITVSLLRSFIAPDRPTSISETQKLTLRDPGIKGRIWVSNYAAPPPPETGVKDALLAAIHHLKPTTDIAIPSRSLDILPVESEWTGYRADAHPNSTLPLISEKDKYAELLKECSSPTTILYFHGGAYYLLDPASHRPTTKKLAKLTGGRCYSVRYRLAPQNPFPSALLDALVSYLTLLYPSPDAYHEPVKSEHIVFAGDSEPLCRRWIPQPPLVTLVMANDWAGAPPIFMCTGWELLADEDKFLALKLKQDGIKVVFEEYEAMPHCFAMILTNLPAAKRCFDGWADFINSVVRDPSSINSKAITIKAKTLQEVELDLAADHLTEDMVRERVQAQIRSRLTSLASRL